MVGFNLDSAELVFGCGIEDCLLAYRRHAFLTEASESEGEGAPLNGYLRLPAQLEDLRREVRELLNPPIILVTFEAARMSNSCFAVCCCASWTISSRLGSRMPLAKYFGLTVSALVGIWP